MSLISLSAQSTSISLPEKHVLDSEIMADKRVIHLRLPTDYHKNTARRYPVVYQLQSADTLLAAVAAVDNLTASGQMPQVILVGIEHQDKFAELTEGIAQNELFYQHLVEELIPFIEANYPTAPFKILSGWSVGGGFVIAKLLQSAPFNGFFAYSPGLSLELNGAVYKKRIEALEGNNQFLMVTIGAEQGWFHENFRQLTELGTTQSPRLRFTSHQNIDHRGNAFVSQFYGFKTLFQGWTPSNELTLAGLDALQAHYQQLSETFGFKVDIPKEILLFSAFSVINQSSAEQLQQGAELVQFTLQSYPETRAKFENMAQLFQQKKLTSKHQMLQSILQE